MEAQAVTAQAKGMGNCKPMSGRQKKNGRVHWAEKLGSMNCPLGIHDNYDLGGIECTYLHGSGV